MDQPASLKSEPSNLFFAASVSAVVKISFVLLILCVVAMNASAQSNTKSWLNGSWEGTGYQTDSGNTWTMSLQVSGNNYKIEYPSLNCNGVWRLLDIDSRSARFKETIKQGVDECANHGNVTIERLNRTQIAFRYSYSGERKITASAILNRTKR